MYAVIAIFFRIKRRKKLRSKITTLRRLCYGEIKPTELARTTFYFDLYSYARSAAITRYRLRRKSEIESVVETVKVSTRKMVTGGVYYAAGSRTRLHRARNY